MSKVRVLFALSFVLTTLFARPSAQAQTYTVLYAFTNGADGSEPEPASLILDAAGNLYGTTTFGAGFNSGTVFELNQSGEFSVLYTFTQYQQLILSGTLYGASVYGGNGGCDPSGCGEILKLNKKGKLTSLYTFTGGSDGAYPVSTLRSEERRVGEEGRSRWS